MENLKNTYEDDDLKQVIEQHEKLDTEAESIMASARSKVGKIRDKQKTLRDEAKSELKIPIKSLKATLATRKAQRKLQKIADNVPDEEAEVFVDMIKVLGDFGDTPLGGAALKAAEKRQDAAAVNQAKEQEEGADILNGMTAGGQKPN